MDGLGAQLQRVIAVRGLAVFWGLSSWQPRIPKIAVHPLDGLDSDHSVDKYMNCVNALINGQILDSGRDVRYVENLGFFAISVIYLRTLVKRKNVFLMISLPYRFVDSLPAIYSLGASNYREKLKQHITLRKVPKIAIHQRWTTGSGVIQPGQKVSRNVSLERFKSVIEQRLEEFIIEEVLIFTDAPSQDIKFIPHKTSQESWKGTAGFDHKGIKVVGQSKLEIESVFPDASIMRGGNPLETLANLSTAKTIILSNSSFGYVAALLSSDSEVFLPKEFWHPPLEDWNTY
jgi:hypothetical protein